MKKAMPKPEYEALRQELLDIIKKHGDKITAEEILATVSYLVGQLIAMQDQTKYTVDQVMLMVTTNIEMGNSDAIQELLEAPGGQA